MTSRSIGWALGLAALVATTAARAQTAGYSEPPDGRPAYAADPRGEDEDTARRPWGARGDSLVRLSVGSAGRTDFTDVRAGLFAAADFGRGPAGVRLSGAWVRVGYDDPLQQYTAELTLALLERSRFVPSIGAGGGLARTYRVDAARQRTDGGASLGVGVLRAGVDYRLPFDGTDARAGVSAIGTMPAIRGEGAPDIGPWLLIVAAVSVGL